MAATSIKVLPVPLPCGCCVGLVQSRFCGEARRLWNLSVRAHVAARGAQTLVYWERYAVTQKAYVDHFVIVNGGKA